jgi:O-antigen/teichoic acid export membrane protein
VLFASIARILGPYQLGQYTLAFSFYFFFMTLTSQGFKTLFTRELARNPQETPVYLVSGTLLQFLFSIVGYGILVAAVFALPYSPETSTVCYILGLTIIPFSLSNITEAIFQAQEKMYLIALSTVPVHILRVLVIIGIMQLGYDIKVVSAIMGLSETLILFVEWGFIIRLVKFQCQIDWSFLWRTTKAARAFLAIEGVGLLRGQIQMLILSLTGGEVVVGLYGAISQLIQPFELIAGSMVLAIFPSMSKAVELGREKQRRLSENLIGMLLIVALPLFIGIVFVGRDLLIFVYRDPGFAEAAIAFKVIALSPIAVSFTRPLSYALVANGFEQVNLREVIITSCLSSLLSVILIGQYQLMGAAIASPVTQLIVCSQYLYAVYVRLFSLQIWQIVRRPLLVSMGMIVVFLALQQIALGILLTLIVATVAYGLLVGGLGVYAFGGPSAVWAKLLRKEQSS